MIVKEETLDLLEEAVANGQFRLADTRFLDVLAELLPVVEEMKYKLAAIEEFLTSDDEEENSENKQEKNTDVSIVIENDNKETTVEKELQLEEKPKAKQKKTSTEESQTKIEEV